MTEEGPITQDAGWQRLAAGMAEQAFELLRDHRCDEDAERRATALSLTALAMWTTRSGA